MSHRGKAYFIIFFTHFHNLDLKIVGMGAEPSLVRRKKGWLSLFKSSLWVTKAWTSVYYVFCHQTLFWVWATFYWWTETPCTKLAQLLGLRSDCIPATNSNCSNWFIQSLSQVHQTQVSERKALLAGCKRVKRDNDI